MEIAKIQSTESSNRIEGIITTNARLKQLVEDKTTPRNRDEMEILGYRNVLNLIHENYAYIPVEPGYILQLHRDPLKYTNLTYRGHFKTTPNEIDMTLPSGGTPCAVPPAGTIRDTGCCGGTLLHLSGCAAQRTR